MTRQGGDSARAAQLAAREDQTEGSARTLLLGASVASLLGAGYALHLAGRESGAPRALLIGVTVLTVILSWALIAHAILLYVYGVVIIAGSVSLISGLFR